MHAWRCTWRASFDPQHHAYGLLDNEEMRIKHSVFGLNAALDFTSNLDENAIAMRNENSTNSLGGGGGALPCMCKLGMTMTHLRDPHFQP